ncbi:DUF2752 domain-containing protein [Okeanomitos corallinicola TIOX110]|uniref:DUF2752 domain-containing protein n=1 Tax=Okeanomitos corallinicola TIOX110 TaxID=3133117 RepID=A0ABZ2UQ80_9CYAN
MTSSFMALARGDWHQALTEHLFGPLLFLGFLIAAVHVTIELFIKHPIKAFYWQLIKFKKLQILGLCTIFIYYLWRLYYLSQTGELYFALINSPLFKIFSGSV